MEDATKPQSDREMILMATAEMKSLRQSVDRLTQTFERFEETKIVSIESRLEELESWRSQLQGGWKLFLLFWAIVTAGIIALIKSL
jgi:hypothetical protein